LAHIALLICLAASNCREYVDLRILSCQILNDFPIINSIGDLPEGSSVAKGKS
jgi:hypothetical protein